MTYQSNFTPNTENGLGYEEFDYIFGCECSDDEQAGSYCSFQNQQDCSVTTQ